MFLAWDNSYKIGVEEIDNQHRELFDLVNKLFDASSKGEGRKIILDVLDQLGEYTIKHLNAEEAYQKKINYPDYPNHKQLHEDFKATYKEIRQNIVNEGVVNIKYLIKTQSTIADWLKNHVLKVDKEIGNFVESQKHAASI